MGSAARPGTTGEPLDVGVELLEVGDEVRQPFGWPVDEHVGESGDELVPFPGEPLRSVAGDAELAASPPSGSSIRSTNPSLNRAFVCRVNVDAASPNASTNSAIDIGPWTSSLLSST
jgi:hypothetical protein